MYWCPENYTNIAFAFCCLEKAKRNNENCICFYVPVYFYCLVVCPMFYLYMYLSVGGISRLVIKLLYSESQNVFFSVALHNMFNYLRLTYLQHFYYYLHNILQPVLVPKSAMIFAFTSPRRLFL